MNKQVTNSTHIWDGDTIEQYGNDRCTGCGMQYLYYLNGLKSMSKWTPEEIVSEQDNYDNIIKTYKVCVPR